MSLVISAKKQNIPPLDRGVYNGICVGIVDEGEQYSERFGKHANKVIFVFEVVGEWVDVGEGELKPRWLSREYTANLGTKSNLYRDLISWRGKEFAPGETDRFDISSMLGEGCQLQVMLKDGKDGRHHNNISSIIGLPKGTKLEAPVSEMFAIDLSDMAKAEKDLEKIPEWMREKVRNSTEWKRAHEGTEVVDIEMESAATTVTATKKEMDDIPF